VFPVSRVGRYLKRANPSLSISKGSSVYMSAVLEYLSAEIIELAGKNCI
jgi:histone H2A